MQDKDILDQIRRDRTNGITLLIQQYGPLIRYIIRPILSDVHAREDCYAEITLRVWERFDQYNPGRGSIAAWLTAIARNTALNLLRSAAQNPASAPISDDVPTVEPSPEDLIVKKEMVNKLRVALAILSTTDRTIIYRKYYYRQPIAQIAAELGMTERAIDGRLYRIKRRLRKELGGEIP